MDGRPDPRTAPSLDALVDRLVELRMAADQPSFSEIARRIGRLRESRGVPTPQARPGRVTVYDAFRHGRSRLDVELLADIVAVLDPGDDPRRWRAAYRDLTRHPASESPRAAVRPRLSPVRPEQPGLVGRDDVLARLVAGARAASDESVHVQLVTGLPGSGKTALARAVVAQLSPPQRPAVEVVARSGSSDRGAATESLVTEVRRVVGRAGRPRPCAVVLDDVADDDAVVAVIGALPPGSLVVATSRRALSIPEATIERLGPLEKDDAIGLLIATLGELGRPTRTGASGEGSDSAELGRLVDLAGRLPLGVVVLASDIAARGHWTLADHRRRFEQVRGTLTPFLSVAYGELDAGEARALRALALHPAPLTAAELAHLQGDDLAPEAVEELLRHLEVRHLVVPLGLGRWDLHDVVRAYAGERAMDEDPYSERSAGVARLVDHLLPRVREVDAAITVDPGGAQRELDWFDTHVDVVVTTALLAADHGLGERVAAMSEALGQVLLGGGHVHDAVAIHEAAMRVGPPGDRDRAEIAFAAALLECSRNEEAHGILLARRERLGRLDVPALQLLCTVLMRMGRMSEAIATADSMVIVAVEGEDDRVIGRAYAHRADLHGITGRYDAWARDAERAEFHATLAGDSATLVSTALQRAHHADEQERYPEAIALARAVLDLADHRVHHAEVTTARCILGEALCWSGQVDEGLAVLREGLRVARQEGIARLEATALMNLGRLAVAHGDAQRGVVDLEAGLEVARRNGFRLRELYLLLYLGEAHRVLGNLEEAEHHLGRVLATSTAQGLQGEGAAATARLGDVALARGDLDRAREIWRAGLERFGSEHEHEFLSRLATGETPLPLRISGL